MAFLKKDLLNYTSRLSSLSLAKAPREMKINRRQRQHQRRRETTRKWRKRQRDRWTVSARERTTNSYSGIELATKNIRLTGRNNGYPPFYLQKE